MEKPGTCVQLHFITMKWGSQINQLQQIANH